MATDSGLIVDSSASTGIASNDRMSRQMKSERSMPVSAWGSLVVVGAVLLVVAIAWVAVWRGMHGGDPEMQQLMARLDAVDKKGETGVLAFGQPQGGVAARVAISGDAEAEPGDALGRLETEFSREPEDPSSSGLEHRLRAAVGDMRLLASAIEPEGVDVKCRREMCRVVADFRDAGDAADWMALYAALIGPEAVSVHRTVFVESADGGTQARLFAIRGERMSH